MSTKTYSEMPILTSEEQTEFDQVVKQHKLYKENPKLIEKFSNWWKFTAGKIIIKFIISDIEDEITTKNELIEWSKNVKDNEIKIDISSDVYNALEDEPYIKDGEKSEGYHYDLITSDVECMKKLDQVMMNHLQRIGKDLGLSLIQQYEQILNSQFSKFGDIDLESATDTENSILLLTKIKFYFDGTDRPYLRDIRTGEKCFLPMVMKDSKYEFDIESNYLILSKDNYEISKQENKITDNSSVDETQDKKKRKSKVETSEEEEMILKKIKSSKFNDLQKRLLTNSKILFFDEMPSEFQNQKNLPYKGYVEYNPRTKKTKNGSEYYELTYGSLKVDDPEDEDDTVSLYVAREVINTAKECGYKTTWDGKASSNIILYNL